MNKMLICCVTFAMLVLSARESCGQVSVAIGANGGLTTANISFDPESNYLSAGDTKSSRTLFAGGAAIDIGFGDAFRVGIEPMYTMGGLVVDSPGGMKNTATSEFLTVPVLLKPGYTIPGSPVRVAAVIGPSVGFKISSKFDVEVPGRKVTVDVDSVTASPNVELIFGGAAQVEIAPEIDIVLDLRYVLGLTDIDKSAVLPGAVDGKMNSRAFQVLAGMMFRL